MRVLILTPSMLPSLTGNAMTAERWRRSLAALGAEVEISCSDGLQPRDLLHRIESFRPDVIHVHHAFKAGSLLLDPLMAPALASLPLVVSPGGTDINVDLEAAGRKEQTLAVLRMARILIVQGPVMARLLAQCVPGPDRIVEVPKSCGWSGDEPYDLRTRAHCGPGDILFFLPAGIRPVKGNLQCLRAIEQLHRIRPQARFVNAGPGLDAEYTERFRSELARLAEFAAWIPAIPPGCMRSAYRAADVVLNASFSEGLSNSLLEAIDAGRPLLVSDISGNSQVLLSGEGVPPGCFFDPDDPADFVEKAAALIDSAELRERLSAAARARARLLPSPQDEARALLAAYRKALTAEHQ